ncbi:hypothetical protein PGB90_006680 [Kerria lacca]
MRTLRRTFSRQICLHMSEYFKLNGRMGRTSSYSTIEKINDIAVNQNTKSFTSFDQVLIRRREEARRSIIVQVKDEKSHTDLLTYCLNFGDVNNTYYYTVDNDESRKKFILIEFANISGSEKAIFNGQHSELENILPVTSSFLWFRTDKKKSKLRTDIAPLNIDSNDLPSSYELDQIFSNSNSFSDDMILLYERTKLGEIGTRLRFITALQLEASLKGLFHSCQVLPFGSSINSFGKKNCDLDLIFDFNEKKNIDSSRLMFHSKTLAGTSKIHNQRHLETIADIIQYFLPGCCNTRRIFKARVPIIKFKHELSGLECDVSSTNLSGVYMSELLYTFAAYDWRVCPLVFTVRYWAKEINLTNPAPGKWITNFMLTLLVLFHLQYEKIIPTLQTLSKSKREKDKKIFIDNDYKMIDCGFLTDLNLLKDPETEPNNDTLLELLFKFFEFYSTFDFRLNAISLNSGTLIPKPVYDPLYIVNPLEKGLNVSKNVSQEECNKMRIQFRNAAWNIECSINSINGTSKKWGLSHLIQSHILNKDGFSKVQNMKGSSSTFVVKHLFTNVEETDSVKKTENV